MGSDLGQNIRKFRKHNELTQRQLAECLFISPQAVSKWESGKALPDVPMLPRIAQIFGVPIDALFEPAGVR